jgi:hypothetical protein
MVSRLCLVGRLGRRGKRRRRVVVVAAATAVGGHIEGVGRDHPGPREVRFVVVVPEALGVVAARAGVPAVVSGVVVIAAAGGAGSTGRGRDCGGGGAMTVTVTVSMSLTVPMAVSLTVTVHVRGMGSAVVGRAGAVEMVAMVVVAVMVVRAILGAAWDIVGAAVVAAIVQCSRASVGLVVVKTSGGHEDGHWRTNFRGRDAVWLPVQFIGWRPQLVR